MVERRSIDINMKSTRGKKTFESHFFVISLFKASCWMINLQKMLASFQTYFEWGKGIDLNLVL